jgi:hypothetical protein
MRNCPICLNLLENIIHIIDIQLCLVNDINLNDKLNIKLCKDCNFYFTDSNNTQEDYNNYYLNFNNYLEQNYCLDKDIKCEEFINKNIDKNEVKTIIDYGSGNGILADLLQKNFIVEKFDIGMKLNNKKYDLLILSHVLEHIYDLAGFINKISENINDNGLLYIEVPNADFYEEFINICPLQEINIEHINFFSKYSLNNLLIKNNFYCVNLQDDYFILKDSKYFVIRGIFKKVINIIEIKHSTDFIFKEKSYNSNGNLSSFEKYINHGLIYIDKYNFSYLKKYENIYIYGCGQLLFKIFNRIQNNCIIINIIDDNPCYFNKKINDINIINYDIFKELCKDGDNILLTTVIHDLIIKDKLLLINKKLNIINISDL